MPEILPNHVPSPRTPLVWDGTRYRTVRGHTDGTVQVRGEDQLFSFESVLAASKTGNPSGANGYYDSYAVPAGEIWVVTTASARDRSAALTHITIANFHAGVEVNLKGELRAIAQWEWVSWHGHTYLDEDDVIRCTFSGCGAGDTVDVDITGYRMTPEV